MKAKRPSLTTFTPTENDIKEVELLAGLGLTKYLIQGYFCYTKETWYKAENAHPALRAAFNKGQAKAVARVAKSLYTQAIEGNTTAMIFYLKTRGGWSDKYDPEQDRNITEPVININVTDPVEASKAYQKIMQGSKKR